MGWKRAGFDCVHPKPEPSTGVEFICGSFPVFGHEVEAFQEIPKPSLPASACVSGASRTYRSVIDQSLGRVHDL